MTTVLGAFVLVITAAYFILTSQGTVGLEAALASVVGFAGVAFLAWGAYEGTKRSSFLPTLVGLIAFVAGVALSLSVFLGPWFPTVLALGGLLAVIFVLAYDHAHPGKVRELAGRMELDGFELKPKEPRVTFAAIGGLDQAKQSLHDLVLGPLKQPALAARYGKELSGGILLYGPPGCGKTLLAEALAKEGGLTYYEVRVSDILSKWMGASEKRLALIFSEAKRRSPSLVLLDEIDGLGLQRGMKLAEDPMRVVLSQLLVELDEVDENSRLFVVGGTNMPWDVDAALLRPGRFDEHLFVPPPDLSAREAIFKIHTARLRQNDLLGPGVDVRHLAMATAGMSGADIADICRDAPSRAVRQAYGTAIQTPVTKEDFVQTINLHKSSVKRWLEIAASRLASSPDSEFGGEIQSVIEDLKRAEVAGYR